jgi:uncharacterized protein
MKKLFLSTAFCMFVSFLFSQKPYNVVFDITSKDTADQQTVIRWIKGISQSNPAAQLEVVLYGQSLDMVTKNKSVVSSEVQELSRNQNITFKVCTVAMKRHNLEASELLPGVQTVPDGIYEIITKQGEGWGYIKAAR